MTRGIEGRRVVVTGGSGLIGRPAVDLLVREGAVVTSLDRVAADLPDGVSQVQGDLRDARTLRTVLAGADAVVHLGGIPGPDLVDDVTTYEVNAVGTYAVFAAAAAAGIRKVVYASSINATGLPIGKMHPPTRFPYGEDEPAAIADAYSLSKQANEQAATMAAARWGLGLTGLRFPLVRDITSDGGAHFAAHIRRALREDPVRQAYEGWSYLHSGDAARAIVHALVRSTPPAPGILVAAPLTYLVDDTADALRLMLPDVPTGALAGRAVGLDLTRSEELLGFRAEILLEDVADGLLASIAGADE